MDIFILVIALAVILLVGTAFFFVRRLSDQKTVESLQQLVGQVQTLTTNQASMQTALNQQMSQSAKETAETLGSITTRLNVIDEAQKKLTDLSSQVLGLQDILDNKQARGAFGEVQLENIVRNALPEQAYDFQAGLSNGKRADCLIRLPYPPGPIVIDAKFPLEAYHALRNAEDEMDRKQAERQFAGDIGKHVSAIAERYIIPGETAESALMFLPSEAVYAELHANHPNVVESSYQTRVWIVSPTTLMATLNTIRAVLRDVKMREQAGLIQQEVARLMDDVERLAKRASNLKRHFNQAEDDVRQIETSAEKIIRRGEKIQALDMEETPPPSITGE
ncbi:MAG: DNA recombination protein RmuC [Parvularculales bacterium]